MVLLLATAVTTATVLTTTVGGWWLIFRRRSSRLTDEDLAPSLDDSEPNRSLHVVDRLEKNERINVKDAFLAGPDSHWLTIGGDGREKLKDETTKKLHRDLTHYMVECTIRFAENYGHVIVCCDKKSQEFLGAIHIVPPYTSSGLYQAHFLRSVIPMGMPLPYQKGKAIAARFDGFWVLEHGHTQFMKDQPHWYVSNLGISSGAQGRGVGRMLMETAKALAGSLPLYLECHDDNVAFYQKCGMKVQKRFMLTAGSQANQDGPDSAPFPYSSMVYTP